MFSLKKDNSKIGQYLSTLINENFESQRDFCREYIKFDGGEVNDEEIRKMANRVSQIIKGKKSIQIKDLPIFTKLLDVSYEEILSAGQFLAPRNDRPTNYNVAFSDNEEVWEEYINHPDELILHMNEYGKTALDYAFENKNSKFINYLIDKGYIWFDEKGGFFANSSIKSDFNAWWNNPNNCYLSFQLNATDFREKVIELAVSENNIELLYQMHAREISQLYYLSSSRSISEDKQQRYDEKINGYIVKANADVIKYFTEEFEVPQYDDTKLVVMYPFISTLLDLLIRENSCGVETALENAIIHSQNAYSSLKPLIEKAINEEYERISQLKEEFFNQEKPRSLQFVLQGLHFDEKSNVINYMNHYSREQLTTNLARVTETSNNDKISMLIVELNESYNKIVNIREEFTNGNY